MIHPQLCFGGFSIVFEFLREIPEVSRVYYLVLSSSSQ
jgi:hypothetical protein